MSPDFALPELPRIPDSAGRVRLRAIDRGAMRVAMTTTTTTTTTGRGWVSVRK